MFLINARTTVIQNRTFSNNYRNTFISDGYIALGKNVELTPNRQSQGDVVFNNTGKVLLVIPDDQFVYFDDGFDASNFTNGEIEVVTYPRSRACTSRGSTLINQSVKNTWRALRPTNDSENEPKVVSKKEARNDFSGLIPSGEDAVYTFLGVKYTQEEVNQMVGTEQTSGQLIEHKLSSNENTILSYPNPIMNYGNTVVSIKLKESKTLSVEICDETGKMIFAPFIDMSFPAGDLEFDFNNTNLKNGIYLVYAKSQGEVLGIHKITVLRK